MQSLDPAGVGARSLRECLLLQLTPDLHYYEEMKTLISNHLEDLGENRLPAIQKATGYSIDLIQRRRLEIVQARPQAGSKFELGMCARRDTRRVRRTGRRR